MRNRTHCIHNSDASVYYTFILGYLCNIIVVIYVFSEDKYCPLAKCVAA